MAHGPEISPGSAGEFRVAAVRGTPGFFHAVCLLSGQWWLVDPAGQPQFICAVHGVRNEPADRDGIPVRAPAVRLREWDFNAAGVGGDGSARDDGLPFLGLIDFCAASNLIHANGIRLPDVFDPEWEQRAAIRAAAVCQPQAENRELIGWVTDDHLGWGPALNGARPGLLQTCLSLEPNFAAYHAAWEFVLALHGGRLEAMARAWGVSLANKEVVREMTRAETAVTTRGYQRDEGRWAREFARRYFSITSTAIRLADSNHLVCGARSLEPVGHAVLASSSYPQVDVPLVHWTEIGAAHAPPGPVLASEVRWLDSDFSPAVVRAAPRGRLTSVERMLRRGRAILRRLARHPAVVGYLWARWADEPGEQPPFAGGLIHSNGSDAREHTELLADFNGRAHALRRAAAKQLSP